METHCNANRERIINIQHRGIISDSKHSLYNVPMRRKIMKHRPIYPEVEYKDGQRY